MGDGETTRAWSLGDIHTLTSLSTHVYCMALCGGFLNMHSVLSVPVYGNDRSVGFHLASAVLGLSTFQVYIPVPPAPSINVLVYYGDIAA